MVRQLDFGLRNKLGDAVMLGEDVIKGNLLGWILRALLSQLKRYLTLNLKKDTVMPNATELVEIYKFFHHPKLKFASSETVLEYCIRSESFTEPAIFERILYWKKLGFFSVFPWGAGGTKIVNIDHKFYETLTTCIIDYRLEN